jgi:hypothetical protein
VRFEKVLCVAFLGVVLDVCVCVCVSVCVCANFHLKLVGNPHTSERGFYYSRAVAAPLQTLSSVSFQQQY